VKYHFRIHNDTDGIWSECLELPGCRSQSPDGTLPALHSAMEEALNLFLDEPDHGIALPLPDPRHTTRRQVVSVPVDPGIALAVRLRHLRHELGISQQEAARRMGMPNLYSWQRLEKGATSNPSLRTLARLKQTFQDLTLEELVS